MKRKNILFIALLIFINPFIYSQNKVSANFGYGIYLSNSENSTNLLGDNNFRSYLFYGISYKRETVLGLNLMFEYSYHQITKNDVLVFVLQSDFGDSISFGTDVTLISHNFDFDYIGNIGDGFSYGIGPSFIISNRIVKVDRYDFKDKLASSGLGVNGFIGFTVPLSKSKNCFLLYIHA
ncbi:hypothetical protein BMS3Abin03_01591 [bacterium BMS3Abin03]|nr:hypothetical protein BMS3Abin03_01591 [bacterium BMS3Abin03]